MPVLQVGLFVSLVGSAFLAHGACVSHLVWSLSPLLFRSLFSSHVAGGHCHQCSIQRMHECDQVAEFGDHCEGGTGDVKRRMK